MVLLENTRPLSISIEYWQKHWRTVDEGKYEVKGRVDRNTVWQIVS